MKSLTSCFGLLDDEYNLPSKTLNVLSVLEVLQSNESMRAKIFISLKPQKFFQGLGTFSSLVA